MFLAIFNLRLNIVKTYTLICLVKSFVHGIISMVMVDKTWSYNLTIYFILKGFNIRDLFELVCKN